MATTTKRIQRIQGPISALNAGQIGVEDTVDADLGFRMHGGKDGAGGVTKWLAKDKPARVSEMTVQDLGAGAVVSDATGRLSTAVIPGFQDLQSVMETGSTATIDTDLELSIVDATRNGFNNPVELLENVRNTNSVGSDIKASRARRRAEVTDGNSYAEVNVQGAVSDTSRDFIAEIASTDGWAARLRCRVIQGVAQIIATAQQKYETFQTGTTVIENDLLEGVVADTESVRNIGLGATTGDVSTARKIIIAESDNDTSGDLGTPGRLTLTVEAQNTAGYAGDSALNVEAFDGAVEKKVVSTGILGGSTFHRIEADVITANGIDLLDAVNAVTLVDDTPWALTAASPKRTLLTGSGSNSVGSLPAANTLTVGREFVIVNAGSNFVPVKNSGTASSVFELVGPGDSLTVVCTNVGSAAGTWDVTRKLNPASVISDPDLFALGTVSGNPQANIGGLVAGSGSSHVMAIDTADIGNMGEVYVILGTGATGGFVYKGNCGYTAANASKMLNHGKPFYGRYDVTVGNVPDGTDAYTALFGLHDSDAVASLPANGVYFKLGAAGQVTPECTTASTPTTGTEGAAIATAASTPKKTRMEIVSNSAGDRVDFWRDKTHAGSITTNIPKTARLYWGFHIARKAGSNQRVAYVSRIRAQRERV